MRHWLWQEEGILAAWAVCRDGKKVLLGLEIGNRKSTESWRCFLCVPPDTRYRLETGSP